MGPSSSIVEHHKFLDVFLQPSLSNRKQSVMSKRAQESTSEEGSAVAKPRPTSFVSRNLLSAKKSLSQDSSASNSPGNQEFDQSYVSSSVRKLVRNNNQDQTAYSQVRRQDDTLSSGTRKLVRSDESVSSASTQRECKPNEIIVEEYTKMFGSRISAVATEKLPGW